MRSHHPATEQTARKVSAPPRSSGTPTIPSFPTVATSTTAPSWSGVTSDTTQLRGKSTWEIGAPASKRTVLMSTKTARSRGRRRWYSSAGSASRSWLAPPMTLLSPSILASPSCAALRLRFSKASAGQAPFVRAVQVEDGYHRPTAHATKSARPRCLPRLRSHFSKARCAHVDVILAPCCRRRKLSRPSVERFVLDQPATVYWLRLGPEVPNVQPLGPSEMASRGEANPNPAPPSPPPRPHSARATAHIHAILHALTGIFLLEYIDPRGSDDVQRSRRAQPPPHRGVAAGAAVVGEPHRRPAEPSPAPDVQAPPGAQSRQVGHGAPGGTAAHLRAAPRGVHAVGCLAGFIRTPLEEPSQQARQLSGTPEGTMTWCTARPRCGRTTHSRLITHSTRRAHWCGRHGPRLSTWPSGGDRSPSLTRAARSTCVLAAPSVSTCKAPTGSPTRWPAWCARCTSRNGWCS